MDTIKSVTELGQEIHEQKMIVKKAKAQYKADLSETDEYQSYQDAKQALKEAKAALDELIANDTDLNDQRVAVENASLKLKDLREILSHHLVTYFKESGNRTIQTGDNETLAREVVLSAKLGRKTVPET